MNYNIKTCGDCPFFNNAFMDGCECGHTDAVKRGTYKNLVGRGETPPKWCPIRQHGGTLEKIGRDSNDNIVAKDILKLKN